MEYELQSHKPFLPSVGLSVDPSTVRSGATWLLERQGSQGEWGEAEMFPDLDQVWFSRRFTFTHANLVYMFLGVSKLLDTPMSLVTSITNLKSQAPVEFQPTAVTAQVVITLASLDHQQKVR